MLFQSDFINIVKIVRCLIPNIKLKVLKSTSVNIFIEIVQIDSKIQIFYTVECVINDTKFPVI